MISFNNLFYFPNTRRAYFYWYYLTLNLFISCFLTNRRKLTVLKIKVHSITFRWFEFDFMECGEISTRNTPLYEMVKVKLNFSYFSPTLLDLFSAYQSSPRSQLLSLNQRRKKSPIKLIITVSCRLLCRWDFIENCKFQTKWFKHTVLVKICKTR